MTVLAARTGVPLLRRQRLRASRMRSAAPLPQKPASPWYFQDDDDDERSALLMDPPEIRFEPFYRVILHYSQWTEGKQIARLVRIAVPVISMNDSIRVVEMAELHETSIVVTVEKEDAEAYVQRLLVAGLIASLELA